MIDLTAALRQFDATEANLKRLEDLWNDIEPLIPRSRVFDSTGPKLTRYADLCRTFRRICETMPSLDGHRLACDVMDIEDIDRLRMDCMELGDPVVGLDAERDIFKQGDSLREYRFRFASERRHLVREAIQSVIAEVDQCLASMQPIESDEDDRCATNVTREDWRSLEDRISQIDALRGSAIPTPRRWGDLHRHLHFRAKQDLLDIITLDWPAAKESLETSVYGPDDPIPVEVEDLGRLVRSAPKGPVVNELNWNAIDAGQFERLIFNLLAQTDGYEQVERRMHTNASDRGRDISAYRTTVDPLAGRDSMRIIVQCKHRPSKGISDREIATMLHQIEAWEPPPIDELIIATTGSFTADAVSSIERRNHSRKRPRVCAWASSDLEKLLWERPHLIGEFGLR